MKLALVIFFTGITTQLFAQSDKQLVMQGNDAYKKSDYSKAIDLYKKAIAKNDKNVEAQYNLGNALYKIKKADDAQKAFESASEIGDKTLKANSAYNKGVVLTNENKLQESIEAYKESLRQNSTDEQVRENLQKAINELKKQDQPKQNNQDKKNNQDNKNDQQDQPKNQSKLNQKQAEKMLNAVRQEEKKLQQNRQKQKNQGGNTPEKDW